MGSEKLQTCSSGGGPVIGIPAELAGQWRGTLGGDYDRACNQIEHHVSMPYGGFGSVPLDGGIAMVLEGPLNTNWVPTAEGGVIVRNLEDWERFGDGVMIGARELVEAIPAASWEPWPGTITLRDGRIWFWDSALEGADDPSQIPKRDTGLAIGTPGPGTYRIATAVDDAEHEFVKLTRV